MGSFEQNFSVFRSELGLFVLKLGLFALKRDGGRAVSGEIDVDHGRSGHVFAGTNGLQPLEFMQVPQDRAGERALLAP